MMHGQPIIKVYVVLVWELHGNIRSVSCSSLLTAYRILWTGFDSRYRESYPPYHVSRMTSIPSNRN